MRQLLLSLLEYCTYSSFKDVISMDIKKKKEFDENQNQIMEKNRKVYEHQRKSHDQMEDDDKCLCCFLCCCAPILCPSVVASCNSCCDYTLGCKCCDHCCNCGSGGSCPLCSDEVCDLLCCIFCCPCMILGQTFYFK